MEPNKNLLTCAANGDLEGVKSSLSQGANINSQDLNGLNALHCAVYNGKIEVVKYLIDKNIDVNVKDKKNYDFWAPIHFCAAFSKVDLLKILLSAGSRLDVSALTGSFQSAYDLASSEEIRILLSQRQDQPQVQQNIFENLSAQLQNPSPIITTAMNNVPSRFKNAKLGRKLLWILFIFLCSMFAFIWLMMDPYSIFPWFIYPDGLMIMTYVLFRKHQKKQEILEKGGNLLFEYHKVVALAVLGLLIFTNIYFRGFPWSFLVIIVWICVLAIHKISVMKTVTENKLNNYFVFHAVFYFGFLVNMFVSYFFATCVEVPIENNGATMRICERFTLSIFYWLIVPVVWGIVLGMHYVARRLYLRWIQQPVVLLDNGDNGYNESHILEEASAEVAAGHGLDGSSANAPHGATTIAEDDLEYQHEIDLNGITLQ